MYLWKDSRLRLRITRLGVQYVVVMGIVGLLGMYTNNNLLHAVFGLMIGLLLVSGWVSRASLQSLEPVGVESGVLFARAKGGLRLRFSDKAPKRVRGLKIRLEIPNCRVEPVFFPGGKGKVSGKNHESPVAAMQVRPEIRGPLAVRVIELSTSYPFGFLEKIWRFAVDMPFFVSPHPGGYENIEGGDGEYFEPDTKSGYSSPVGARPFLPGDSLNRIHWKRTAQRGEPWVRVMEGDQPRGLILEIDLGEWAQGPAFERELENLSGAILQARVQKQDVTLTIYGRHGRIDAAGHLAAWRALSPLEAEGGNDAN
jgi:uncharacterized protein (DUF58 family)